jgi:hypothetical protein
VLDEDIEALCAGAGDADQAGAAAGETADGELSKVKERIRKMLTRGLHQETPEAEASSSMRLAEKLLAKHNLKQADVLDDASAGVPEALRGGKTAVHLRFVKDRKPCQTKQWMHTLGATCTTNFDCSYYFSSHVARTVGSGKSLRKYNAVCDFTFYGIATNASLAAFAFAAAFKYASGHPTQDLRSWSCCSRRAFDPCSSSRVAALSAAHSVPDDEYVAKRRRMEVSCSKAQYTTVARESYRDGLAAGLLDAVRKAKKQKELDQQRRLEMARAKASRGEAWQESDDDDDDDGGGGDGGGGGGGGGDDDDDAGGGGGAGSVSRHDDDSVADKGGGLGASSSLSIAKTEESPVKLEQQDGMRKEEISATDAVVKYEREQRAATALVAHTARVAEEFLKTTGVKLSNKKHSYTQSAFRRASFEQGKLDAKEIDLEQRSLAPPPGGSDAARGSGP